MFSNFFFSLKKAEIPVSLKEYLTFLDAVKHGVAEYSLNDFYYLSRSSLVKDERHIDRFDQVFGQTVLVYFICQSLVDLSMVHWPLAISITAICLSIPLQSSSHSGDIAD